MRKGGRALGRFGTALLDRFLQYLQPSKSKSRSFALAPAQVQVQVHFQAPVMARAMALAMAFVLAHCLFPLARPVQ